MKASILSIGNELLLGHTTNTNAQWLLEQFALLGIPVQAVLTVGDHIQDIVEGVSFCTSQADIIVLTGGLGPTSDDKTRDALSQFFGLPLEVDNVILEEIKKKFIERKRVFTENNKLQAMLPQGAIALQNSVGIAPGIYINKNQKHFFAFPGVPAELYDIFTHQALPILQQLSPPSIHHFFFILGGTYESFLSNQLKDFESIISQVATLAYLPSPGYIKLRITCEKSDIHQVEKLVEHHLLPIIGPYLINRDNKSIEETLIEELKKRHLTIGTCESCTGGYIAHRITTVPGSSSVFKGSIVSYANDIKHQLLNVPLETLSTHGAVSRETVYTMARMGQKLLGVDVCLAVSGIAGPDGGTREKPVGYTWGAIAYQNNIHTFSFQFGNQRLTNIQWATYSLLFQAIKLIRSNS